MLNLFIRRGVAFILDAFFLLLIFLGNFGFVWSALEVNVDNPMNMSGFGMLISLNIIYALIYFIYIPIKMPGQTFGKKLLKIKEVTLDGKELMPKQYFQRDFVVKFLLATFTQGFIVLFNVILLAYQFIRKQELRALQDILVKTKVVRVK